MSQVILNKEKIKLETMSHFPYEMCYASYIRSRDQEGRAPKARPLLFGGQIG
jgi:hypothetical protein